MCLIETPSRKAEIPNTYAVFIPNSGLSIPTSTIFIARDVHDSFSCEEHITVCFLLRDGNGNEQSSRISKRI